MFTGQSLPEQAPTVGPAKRVPAGQAVHPSVPVALHVPQLASHPAMLKHITSYSMVPTQGQV